MHTEYNNKRQYITKSNTSPKKRKARNCLNGKYLIFNEVYEGPAKCFVTGFGLLQCYVLSNIFLLQTFKVFPFY